MENEFTEQKKLNIQEGAYLTIGWTQYDVPFFWFESSDVFHDFSFHGYE